MPFKLTFKNSKKVHIIPSHHQCHSQIHQPFHVHVNSTDLDKVLQLLVITHHSLKEGNWFINQWLSQIQKWPAKLFKPRLVKLSRDSFQKNFARSQSSSDKKKPLNPDYFASIGSKIQILEQESMARKKSPCFECWCEGECGGGGTTESFYGKIGVTLQPAEGINLIIIIIIIICIVIIIWTWH